MTAEGRHLSLTGLEQYLRSGVLIEHPIDGDPRLTLIIDPSSPAIGLRAPRGHDEALPRVGLEHVHVLAGRDNAGRYLEIRVTDSRLFEDAYPVLCAIADRVQLQGLSFAAAVVDTLRLLGRLLRTKQALSRERELGLCGELLVLIGLSRLLGAETAVESWRGPHTEEHDFGLADVDVEVKTTCSERRTHWVESLTQMEPTENRPLWFVSHQLTEAGPGDGWRLADLVTTARREVSNAGLRHELDLRLVAAGWVDVFAESCRTRWRRRFPSAAYLVAEDFPRLTATSLREAGLSSPRLVEARYRIDLTRQPAGGPVHTPLSGAIAIEVTP